MKEDGLNRFSHKYISQVQTPTAKPDFIQESLT
ncbi:hypothetical protein KP509_38G001700 [Ceratopteris richardii]|uniref:Uncharacterized protein n=1 Tax=Ceratopteris richardii TaxID=49495 RepID=A0A8T2Q1N9_CERRI|nr:hypothetical protein KP509_38G001700 [Ceratopteris richardii]